MRSTRDIILIGMTLLAAPASATAQTDAGLDTLPRIEISIAARQLWVIDLWGDTIFTAPVAVGSGKTLRTQDRSWTFRTPTGATIVRAKEVAPVWIPPDWHYIELARKLGYDVQPLAADRPVLLARVGALVVRGTRVGVVGADSIFRELPQDEEIIFGRTLYIPPYGADNRRVAGTLGPYRLLLANGVGLHGTPDKDSIGKAVTHGCIRLHDEDITWLYNNVPVGSPVLIR